MLEACQFAGTSAKDALLAARHALLHLAEPALEAELIVALALNVDRVGLRRDLGRHLTDHEEFTCATLVASRARGVPYAYLSGKQEFWSLEIKVDETVLVPRSETELLVSLALEKLKPYSAPVIADLGTGSGAIAVALAHERSRSSVVAVDRELAALQVARRNAALHHCDNIMYVQAHWCNALTADMFDIIVSNPPYIREDDPALASDGVGYEPRTALVAGPDGLRDLRELAGFAPNALRANGWLLVEHGNTQGAAVRAFFAQSGLNNVVTCTDFADHERVTLGQKSSA
jgi:release factor glutamine methyltransferase